MCLLGQEEPCRLSMSHKIDVSASEIEESDRPYFRILWRYLDSSHKPDAYEFSRVVLSNCVQWYGCRNVAKFDKNYFHSIKIYLHSIKIIFIR